MSTINDYKMVLERRRKRGKRKVKPTNPRQVLGRLFGKPKRGSATTAVLG